jgi:hypothetical protein
MIFLAKNNLHTSKKISIQHAGNMIKTYSSDQYPLNTFPHPSPTQTRPLLHANLSPFRSGHDNTSSRPGTEKIALEITSSRYGPIQHIAAATPSLPKPT